MNGPIKVKSVKITGEYSIAKENSRSGLFYLVVNRLDREEFIWIDGKKLEAVKKLFKSDMRAIKKRAKK